MAKPFTPVDKHFILRHYNDMETWLIAYKLNRPEGSVKRMHNKLLKTKFNKG